MLIIAGLADDYEDDDIVGAVAFVCIVVIAVVIIIVDVVVNILHALSQRF